MAAISSRQVTKRSATLLLSMLLLLVAWSASSSSSSNHHCFAAAVAVSGPAATALAPMALRSSQSSASSSWGLSPWWPSGSKSKQADTKTLAHSGTALARNTRPSNSGSSSSSSRLHSSASGDSREPLIVRAARGEAVERTPIWIMRQAGRHMAAYRDLCKQYPTFRQRSENATLSAEISLQPVRAYDVDGCILFSDILTPLPAMGVDFDILEGVGPVISNSNRNSGKQVLQGGGGKKKRGLAAAEADSAASSGGSSSGDNWFSSSVSSIDKHLKPIDLRGGGGRVAFVGQTLRKLRAALAGTDKAVMGFAGLPFTLAAYMVEGGSSSNYKHVKGLMFRKPAVMHHLLRRLADNIAAYVCYQIENGAQVVQLFDSWAGELAPAQYSEFASAYHKYIISKVKAVYPSVPIILFVHKGAAPYVESMGRSGADVVSVDWTVDVADVRRRLNTVQFMERLRKQFQGLGSRTDSSASDNDNGDSERVVSIQGNLDPMVLLADKATIEREAKRVLDAAAASSSPSSIAMGGKAAGRGGGHIMNLGHGIDPSTREDAVRTLVNFVKRYKHTPPAGPASRGR